MSSGALVAVVYARACGCGDDVLCGACAIGWATLRVVYIMLGSVRALYCMSYRCMLVCGRRDREKLVLMVQMGAVSAVSAVSIERAVSIARAVSSEVPRC